MYDHHDPLPFDPPFDPLEDLPDDGQHDRYPVDRRSGTVYPFRARPVDPPPPNNGKPWTDEQHELLVERVRSGDDLTELAHALGRTPGSVTMRMKRLLPPDNRDHPSDLVLTVLRELLADPDADWRANLLRSTTPRPVITPPPVIHTGVAGLQDDDLLPVAYALLTHGGANPGELLQRTLREVSHRGLTWKIVTERVRELRYSPGSTLSEYQLIDLAEAWVREAELL